MTKPLGKHAHMKHAQEISKRFLRGRRVKTLSKGQQQKKNSKKQKRVNFRIFFTEFFFSLK